jgi:hypothetical protein
MFVGVRKSQVLSCLPDEKSNCRSSVRRWRNPGLDQNFHGDDLKWNEVRTMANAKGLFFCRNSQPIPGMTQRQIVIDCWTKFWEYDQVYVTLSRVKSAPDVSILDPSDMDAFTVCPLVDRNIVQILESMSSSRPTVIRYFHMTVILLSSMHVELFRQRNFLSLTIMSMLTRREFLVLPFSVTV